MKYMKCILLCSLPDTKQGRQREQGGGPSQGFAGGVLDDVLWVDLVFLKDHEDRRIGHAVHTAVIEDTALVLLSWGADKGGTASGELAHQHPRQEHRVEL